MVRKGQILIYDKAIWSETVRFPPITHRYSVDFGFNSQFGKYTLVEWEDWGILTVRSGVGILLEFSKFC